MPRIAKDRIEENRRRIKTAALKLFTKHGFHGTNIREISEEIGISTGAIYTYYPSKEAIFDSLVQSYRARTQEWLKQTCAALQDPISKRDLVTLAGEVRSLVYRDPEYLLLIYIDVVEFQNQHFAETFRDVPEQFRRLLGPSLSRTSVDDGWRGEDVAFVMASVYMYFFTYAGIERLYRGNRHLGVSDEQAAEHFANLLCRGLWNSTPDGRPDGPQESATDNRGKREIQALHKQAQERIDLMRLLAGRLWSSPPDTSTNDFWAKAEPMLFVPKVSRTRIDQTQLRIEAAALELFTSRGFHSTRMREIAEKAEISSGSIYTYYPSKEALFESLVKSYRSCMGDFRKRVLSALEEPFSKNDLRLLAFAVRSMVYHDSEYQLLMFIDIIEFGNQHFADTFYRMPEQFRHVLGPVLNKVKKQKGWCGEDPAFVLAVIYLYFFTYFVVEHLMQRGNQHLGIPDDEAIERFIDLLSHGLWSSPVAVSAGNSQSQSQSQAEDGLNLEMSAMDSGTRKSLRQLSSLKSIS
jgi:AcrR family transcriptional regulator